MKIKMNFLIAVSILVINFFVSAQENCIRSAQGFDVCCRGGSPYAICRSGQACSVGCKCNNGRRARQVAGPGVKYEC